MMGRRSLRGTFLVLVAIDAVHTVVRRLTPDLRPVSRRRAGTTEAGPAEAGALAGAPSPLPRPVDCPVGERVINPSRALPRRDAGRAGNLPGGIRLNVARTPDRARLIDRDRQARRSNALLDRGPGYVL
jgi:hypothetical protein